MCITALALEAHPCFPFILVHTRVEDWDRATEPVQTLDDGNGNGALVFARDVQAGGTFLGLNLRTFGFGAITNIRSNVPRPDHTPSRGELVIRAIRGEALEGSAHTAYSLHHGTVVPPTAPLDRSLPSDDGWKRTSVKVAKAAVERAGRSQDNAVATRDGVQKIVRAEVGDVRAEVGDVRAEVGEMRGNFEGKLKDLESKLDALLART